MKRMPVRKSAGSGQADFRSAASPCNFLANDKLTELSIRWAQNPARDFPIFWRCLQVPPQGGSVWLHAEPHMVGASQRKQVRLQRRSPPSIDEGAERGQSPRLRIPGREFGRSFNLEIFDDFFRSSGQRIGGRHGARTGHCPPSFCKAWEVRSGWKANRARAASFPSSFH